MAQREERTERDIGKVGKIDELPPILVLHSAIINEATQDIMLPFNFACSTVYHSKETFDPVRWFYDWVPEILNDSLRNFDEILGHVLEWCYERVARVCRR